MEAAASREEAQAPAAPANSGPRLRIADWVGLLAALALLLTTAADWYSSVTGEEARRIEGLSQGANNFDDQLREEARLRAEAEEQNAWQASALVDRLVLAGLLLTAALTALGTVARARGRTTAMAPAGIAAGATALLVAYRLLQEPGFDDATTVEWGAPLAIVLLGAIAVAAAVTLREEPAPA